MAHDHILLEVVILLGITVVLVSLSRRIHLPPILNYIVVGAIVGPFGFAVIESEENIHFLAEFGIVFLLFAIGLEFSLPQMMAMRKIVFGYGGLQVLITGAVVFGFCILLDLNFETSFVIASAFALSSTAIVIKQLTEQSELQTRHGRAAVGILIFQDIMAIPLLILIPALSMANKDMLPVELGISFLKGMFVVVVMLVVGRYILRPLFHEVASSKSQELFTLTVLTVVLAAAAFTEEMEISMTLGAFMAGMMLGETEFRHQIEADIRPFQDILLGLFFVTVGMLISPILVYEKFFLVIGIALGIMLLKAILIFSIMRLFGKPDGVGVRTAVTLAQVGEFGLVLMTLALSYQILDPQLGQLLLTSAVFSMLFTPFLVKFNGSIAKAVFSRSYKSNFTEIESAIESEAKHLKDHVVLLGFGRVGQTISKFLKQANLQFVALDMDIRRVQEAQHSGEPVFFGDAAKENIIKATNIDNAKIVIITHHDYHSAIKTLKSIKNVSSDIPILVRTVDDAHLEELIAAGATEVVPDTFEASIMLASHLLLMIGQPPRQVLKQTREARANRYSLLEGVYLGETDHIQLDHSQLGQIIQPINIEDSAFAVGKRLGELPFKEHNVEVKSIRRGSVKGDDPDSGTRIRAQDVLIIQGLPEGVEKMEKILLSGGL